MDFVVESSIFELFPEARIGLVIARGVDNRRAREPVEPLLREAEAAALAALGKASLADDPRIAPWRAAYRAFGARPKKHRSSIESLLRRVRSGEPVRSVSPLVDLYNVVSLRHLLPVGGEDLDRIEGDLRLVRAGPDEPAVLLLGEAEPRAPRPGEVIYRDDVGAVCRRWNWKEAERTKLTEATRNAVLVVEILGPDDADRLVAALSDLAGLVERIVGGRARVATAERQRPRVSLD